VIELYKHDKDNTVERECEYVYTLADYQAWLASAREPLRSASILAHDGGICRGELLALQWDCIKLSKAADDLGFWGTIEIRRGLKRKERRRDIPITEDIGAVLLRLKAQSKCQHVFTSLHDHTQPLSVNTLADQHRVIMETCSFHPDAGLHALRHTFLTEAGRHTQNVRALQKLAGHSRIQTTMRYVHPDQTDVLEIASAVQQSRAAREKASAVTTNFTTAGQQETAGARKM
jgi:integrase